MTGNSTHLFLHGSPTRFFLHGKSLEDWERLEEKHRDRLKLVLRTLNVQGVEHSAKVLSSGGQGSIVDIRAGGFLRAVVCVSHGWNAALVLRIFTEPIHLGAMMSQLKDVADEFLVRASSPAPLVRPPVASARRMAAVAARLAGARRPHLGQEWSAILAGDPEHGALAPTRQLVLAAGLLRAALRMRLRDAARSIWRPFDWVLTTSSRTNAFIASTVGVQAVYIVGDDGLTALMTEVWEPCGIAGASLFALARWLRSVRGIEWARSEHERDGEGGR
ncbi:hypothetical protein [Streptomyces sp. NBC_01455]|uniref:hypothetical protein n=1 Tax=Streptomyces sp. NBC_01455 TaxID=2903874 RepID=UPI002E323315|nr:hypothetical protein [Streptomyces sp. NBC_01455]